LAYPGAGAFQWDFFTVGVRDMRFEDVLATSQGAVAKHVPFVRVALNYLLLATGHTRLVCPPNPAQVRHIRAKIKRAKKDRKKDKVDELRSRLRRLPSVYALAQEIKLFDREQPPVDRNPEADGTPKRPHFRKGHWRQVAVGAGRVGREWRFIRPVLVNGHLMPVRVVEPAGGVRNCDEEQFDRPPHRFGIPKSN
jgi:hypothetical protein